MLVDLFLLLRLLFPLVVFSTARPNTLPNSERHVKYKCFWENSLCSTRVRLWTDPHDSHFAKPLFTYRPVSTHSCSSHSLIVGSVPILHLLLNFFFLARIIISCFCFAQSFQFIETHLSRRSLCASSPHYCFLSPHTLNFTLSPQTFQIEPIRQPEAIYIFNAQI